jgi:alkylated DNA repair dioxygenase AlkB
MNPPVTPPITLVSDFLPDAGTLLARLRDSVEWDTRMRARRTASFGVSYDYSQISYPETPMLPELALICHGIERRLKFYPNNCLINYYLDGASAMGFHSDSSEELAPGTGVAIVSLGAERPIVYRNKADRSIEHAYPLAAGTLLYMSQEMQAEWLHAIPKAEGCGERISLTFRQILK